jgi:hypothetical protein
MLTSRIYADYFVKNEVQDDIQMFQALEDTQLGVAMIKKQAFKIKKDEEKTTPLLIETVRQNDPELTEALLEAGAYVDGQIN